VLNFTRRFLGAFGQYPDFVGHHREAATLIAGTSGFDRRVQGEQVGLLGDIADDVEDRADALAVLLQLADDIAGTADFFREAGDVDAAAAILTLDDGAFAHVAGSRYNARGYDVRLEVLGSRDSISVGLDDRLPLRSVEPGVSFPGGAPYPQFMERFRPAYVAELAAFTDVVAGRRAVPCTVADALEAFYVAEACELSRARRRPVALAEVRP